MSNQKLWDFFHDEHKLTLTESELFDIIHAVEFRDREEGTPETDSLLAERRAIAGRPEEWDADDAQAFLKLARKLERENSHLHLLRKQHKTTVEDRRALTEQYQKENEALKHELSNTRKKLNHSENKTRADALLPSWVKNTHKPTVALEIRRDRPPLLLGVIIVLLAGIFAALLTAQLTNP